MNEMILAARAKAGLKQWQVAELAGYREDKFCRMLRHELPKEEQERIVKLIEDYKKEKIVKLINDYKKEEGEENNG